MAENRMLTAAIGIGFEVSINLKEIYNFFTDLFK